MKFFNYMLAGLLMVSSAGMAQNMMYRHHDSQKFLSFNKQSKGMKRVSNFNKADSIVGATSYGSLDGEDGSTWLYTTKFTPSTVYDYAYGSAEITLYDGNSQKVTTVTYNVPDTMKVNYIEPFGAISSKFYDTNSKTQEFTVYVHEIGPNYQSIGHVLVYNTTGELVKEYQVGNIVWFDASKKWNTYQRAVFVTAGVDSLGNATTKMSVMKNASWNTKEPTVEHVFEVRDDLCEYSDGPTLNMYNLENPSDPSYGDPYYVLSYYEKPFVAGYGDDYNPIFTEDNNFIVEVYNKDYEKIHSFKIPTTHPDDVYCSEFSMGLYSYNDLTRGYYTGDNKMNLVITRQDVRLDTSDDTYPYAFLVYDEDGNKVKTIAENVIDWRQLQDIKGEEDQAAFLCLNDETETLQMIRVPSCETQVVFEVNDENGRQISNNCDRYSVGGTYQYAISMGDALYDEDKNIIASIGWYNKEGKFDHYTNFNLGKNGEYFTPLIEGYTLNPSLFNTDSKREYVYIAKTRRTDGSDKIDNVLVVADEDGKELARYSGGDARKLRLASVLDAEIGNPRLIVGLYSEDEDNYNLDFYNLPYVKFGQGGDGTKENPYVIASAGDMKQISTGSDKTYYILGNDIDMSEIADAWTPLEKFYGEINGNGKTIENLYVKSDASYSGLFGYLNNGASVKELNFRNASMTITPGNSYVGLVAGMTMMATVDSVTVDGYDVKAESGAHAEFGGIIGQATYYSVLASDAVVNANIDIPGCANVGGIVGDTRTNTNVDACLFKGNLVGNNTIGGIVGTCGTSQSVCSVKNCHVDAAVEAETVVGGIIGYSERGEVKNNFAEGTVCATSVDMYNDASAGGIIGQVATDWKSGSTKLFVGNVAGLTSLDAPKDAYAVHRIIGFSAADEQYEEGESHKSEKGLSENYASSDMDISASITKGSDTPDGLDYETLSRSFLEGIGFAYGETAAAPWTGDAAPQLYFEEKIADDIEQLNVESSKLNVDAIYNLAGQRVGKAQKGIFIINGKKILMK